jgi:hypothetical protein
LAGRAIRRAEGRVRLTPVTESLRHAPRDAETAAHSRHTRSAVVTRFHDLERPLHDFVEVVYHLKSVVRRDGGIARSNDEAHLHPRAPGRGQFVWHV